MRLFRLVAGSVLIVAGCFLFMGCALEKYNLKVAMDRNGNATTEHFFVCHDNGCLSRSEASLTETQWNKIIALFDTPADHGEAERRRIAAAIAMMENFVGEAVGTDNDKGKNSLREVSGQMDCVDETINTSLYLRFLEEEGVLRWHGVAEPAHRGYVLNGMLPHNTAVIIEKPTGNRYAVDSWFFDNGKEPAIVTLKEWMSGWRP